MPKVLVQLPPGLLEQVDAVADLEHRNRSDLIRESLRRYLDIFRQKNPRVQLVAKEQDSDETEKDSDERGQRGRDKETVCC